MPIRFRNHTLLFLGCFLVTESRILVWSTLVWHCSTFSCDAMTPGTARKRKRWALFGGGGGWRAITPRPPRLCLLPSRYGLHPQDFPPKIHLYSSGRRLKMLAALIVLALFTNLAPPPEAEMSPPASELIIFTSIVWIAYLLCLYQFAVRSGRAKSKLKTLATKEARV